MITAGQYHMTITEEDRFNMERIQKYTGKSTKVDIIRFSLKLGKIYAESRVRGEDILIRDHEGRVSNLHVV